MHTLSTGVIAHDPTTSNTNSIHPRALASDLLMDRNYFPHGKSWDSYTHTSQHPQPPGVHTVCDTSPHVSFFKGKKAALQSAGRWLHKESASTDETVAMPLHGATKPSACTNSTVRQLSLHNSTG